VATQVHHIYGKDNGPEDLDALVASCAECNQAVGDPTKVNPTPLPFPLTW